MTKPPPRCIVRSPKSVRDLHAEHVARWAGDTIGGDREPTPTTQPNTLRATSYEDRTVIDADGLPLLRDTA